MCLKCSAYSPCRIGSSVSVISAPQLKMAFRCVSVCVCVLPKTLTYLGSLVLHGCHTDMPVGHAVDFVSAVSRSPEHRPFADTALDGITWLELKVLSTINISKHTRGYKRTIDMICAHFRKMLSSTKRRTRQTDIKHEMWLTLSLLKIVGEQLPPSPRSSLDIYRSSLTLWARRSRPYEQ